MLKRNIPELGEWGLHKKHKLLLVQPAGHRKPHWMHLNSKSKPQITLSRIFASSKALNSMFFVDIMYVHKSTRLNA